MKGQRAAGGRLRFLDEVRQGRGEACRLFDVEEVAGSLENFETAAGDAIRIPGLGSFTIDAIQSQDFAIVRSMVYLGSLLYIAGLILTDISYTLVDPRVRLS